MSIISRLTSLLLPAKQTPAIRLNPDPYSKPENLISGYEYVATLQLRTPLAALLKDGEVVKTDRCPENEFGMMHGIWMPKTKSWREMGIDIDEFQPGNSASDAGQVDRVKYRNFLISIRMISEDVDRSIQERIAAIRPILKDAEFSRYCRRLGGQGAVIDNLFNQSN
jgi:hypothetical protein